MSFIANNMKQWCNKTQTWVEQEPIVGRMMCSHCGQEFQVKDARVTHLAPTHDYPKPCRSVCPGSGKNMYRWGDVTKPLGKDRKEPMPRSTHTHANLEVSPSTHEEIAGKLKDAGYEHAFDNNGTIDMHGIALVKEKIVLPTPAPGDKVEGHLLVGHNDKGEVVIDLGKDMTGHVNFSPNQARQLAINLLKRARLMDPRTLRTIEEDLRDYLNELANPAPDATMRMMYREKLSAHLGMEAPHVTQRKWNEGSKKK